MNPVFLDGMKEIGKPKSMTDEECFSVGAYVGIDDAGYHFFCTAWKPSYEDLQALNRGEPIYIKSLCDRLVPMSVFTIDENGQHNDSK